MKISTSKSETNGQKRVDWPLQGRGGVTAFYVPTMVMSLTTERTLCLSSPRGLAGLSLRDKLRSSDIWEELRIEPLLLGINRSQRRWVGHLVRTHLRCLPREALQPRPSGRRPGGRPSSGAGGCRPPEPDKQLEDKMGCGKAFASLLAPVRTFKVLSDLLMHTLHHFCGVMVKAAPVSRRGWTQLDKETRQDEPRED